MKKEKVLIIVESPGKIKKIKSCLPDDKDYIVLASGGHVADLSHKYKYSIGVNVEKDFKPDYITSKDRLDILNAIINAAAMSSKILLATDPDREGECIAALIAERLQSCKKPIKRIVFKEIQKKEILKGLNNERDIDYNLVDAAKARRVLDRIVGYMASPFVITFLGKGLSAGRVQSVALKLVVEREKDIKCFKPKEYWTIKANLGKDESNTFTAILDKKDISTKVDAENLKKDLENSIFVVSDVVNKPKPRAQPEPLITSSLQMLASSRYKLSPSETMEAAQTLYEEGHITYMRTDSKRISDDAIDDIRNWINQSYPQFLPATKNAYKNKDSSQDAHEAIRPIDINKNPVKTPMTNEDKIYKLIWEITVASQMTPAIYNTTSVKIITNKKMLLKANGRVLFDPGWMVITVKADISDVEDKDSLLPILYKGDKLDLFDKKVIAEQKFTQPPTRYKESTLIADLEKKGIGRPATYHTIMNKICETRGYIDKISDHLQPTHQGMQLVRLLDKYFSFMKYGYTSEMEDKLEIISKGEATYLDTISSFYKDFRKELIKANKEEVNTNIVARKLREGKKYNDLKKKVIEENLKKKVLLEVQLMNKQLLDKENEIFLNEISGDEPITKEQLSLLQKECKSEIDKNNTGFFCKDCEYPMILRESKNSFFLGCAAFPHCKNTVKCKIVDNEIVITEHFKNAPDHIHCPKCKGSMVIVNGKFGEYYRCGCYPECIGKKKIPFGSKCPDCGGDLYKTIFTKPPNEGPVLCCMQYPECKYVKPLVENYDSFREAIEVRNKIAEMRKNTVS